MSFENFRLERDGASAVPAINRPRVLHALNSSTIDHPRRAVPGPEHDAAVRLVIAGVSRRLEASFDQRRRVEAPPFGPIASTAGPCESTPAFLEIRKAHVTGR